MIVQRSGRDFDNFVGPILISAALLVALLLNFVFKVTSRSESSINHKSKLMPITVSSGDRKTGGGSDVNSTLVVVSAADALQVDLVR
jgi:hypothetical protein